MYDYERYAAKLKELGDDPAALEAFLLEELAAVDQPLASGGSCPCSKSQQELDGEVVSWVRDRLTTQIILRNDLAGIYRAAKDWAKCESVFDDMILNIREAELIGSPLYGRILLNRACMYLEAGNLDAALDNATIAASIFDSDADIDTDSVVAVYNLIAAIYAKQGNDQLAVQARDMADEARKK